MTLLDTRPNILDFLDEELKQRLLYRMLNAGVVMHFGEEVTAVAVPEADRVEARCGSGQVVTAERVLYAAGRIGNTDQLGLKVVWPQSTPSVRPMDMLTGRFRPRRWHRYEIGHAFYRETARAHIMGDTEGMLKLIFHRETLQLLGVHIIGEHASELIHIGQAVIAYGGTIEYFIDNVVNYPTLSEAYKVAALNDYNRL